ncbi:hypothetical protein CSB11_00940 [Candidatus Campbellbacteria bacterium]|nr:MAG: hypothetical protein CSB11_00940 [Candidatus Campbellbacteria bacterium]
MIKNLKIIIAFVVGIFLLIAVVLGYFGLSDFDKKKAKYDIASKNASIIKDDLFKQKISSKEHQKDMELSLNEIFKVDQSSNNDNNKEKRVIKPYDLSTLPPEPDAELVKTEFVDVNNTIVFIEK